MRVSWTVVNLALYCFLLTRVACGLFAFNFSVFNLFCGAQYVCALLLRLSEPFTIWVDDPVPKAAPPVSLPPRNPFKALCSHDEDKENINPLSSRAGSASAALGQLSGPSGGKTPVAARRGSGA